MSKSNKSTNQEGISPVIGVILMVAIVVALVALVSIVAFNIGGDTQQDYDTASIQLSESQNGKVTAKLLDETDASKIIIETAGGETTISEPGDTVTVDSFGEQINAIAVSDDGERTVLQTFDPAESGITTSDDSNTTFVSPEDSTTAGSIDGNTYNTLEAAEDAVSSGDSIIIQSGVHRVPNTVQATVSKEVTIGVQDNVVFECDSAANNGNVNLNFTIASNVVNGAQDIATRNCGNPEIPPGLEDSFSVSLSDRTVQSGSPAMFSASISDIGQEDIQTITWDFGNGNGGTGNPVTHTYSSTSDYTVNVEVTSKEGTTESATATYNVESSPTSVDPVAAFDYSPVGPTVNQEIDFNASDSTDQDGSVSSYEWDLDDDGTFETTGIIASKVYNSTGEKNVRLRVTDDSGNTDTTIQSVLVDSTGDVNPEFSVDLTNRTVPVNEGAVFSANISNIGISQIQSVDWSFGDGSSASGTPVTHSYSSTGDYSISITVTSDQEVTESDSATVTVTSNPPSEQLDPEASIRIMPESPVTGEQVTFDGGGSQDIDGVVSSYEWDLDNDGSFEKSGEEVSRSYDTIRERNVRLRVTDNNGNADTVISSFLVRSSSDSGGGNNGGGGSCGCIYDSGDDSESSSGSGSSNIILTGVVEVNPKIQGATVRAVDVDTGEVLDTSTTNSEGEYSVVAEESSDEIRVVTENDVSLNSRPFYASAERQVADRVAVDFNFTETVNSTVNGAAVTVAYSVSQENTEKQVGIPYEVQAMSEDLDGTYRLIRDIELSGTSSWNSGSGFKPIASGSGLATGDGDEFEGEINGENHSMSGLYIDRADTSLGLISQAYEADISGLNLSNVDINHDATVSDPVSHSGGLYGSGDSVTVRNVDVSGAVSSQDNIYTGGLAGYVSFTDISDTSSAVEVTAGGLAGGLVGTFYSGTIDQSSATGTVTSNQDSAGGLVGQTRQANVEISSTYATGSVTGDSATGGLIGFMRAGQVSESFASGDVVSNNSVSGGLVGNSSSVPGVTAIDSSIVDTYATGSVDGSSVAGGLVGEMDQSSNTGDTIVESSFATGELSSSTSTGGLVGSYSGSSVSGSYWDTESTGVASSVTGTGLTTSEMQGYTPSPDGSNTMSGLNFITTWDTVTGSYPILSSIDATKQVDSPIVGGGGGGSGGVSVSSTVKNNVFFGTTDGVFYSVDQPDLTTQRWSYDILSNFRASPAVVDETLYIADGNASSGGRVHALNADTGAVQWTYRAGLPIPSSPAVINGTVYIGSLDDNLYALDASNGNKKWSTSIDNVRSSPAVVNGVVYVGTGYGGNSVHAVYASNGTEKWEYTTGDKVYSSPAVVNGTVYIGSNDGNLYALNATDGSEEWLYNIGNRVRYSSPAVAYGTVYIGSFGSKVYAVNASTGSEEWTYDTGARVSPSSPTALNGNVYIGNNGNGKVYALNASDGSKVWETGTSGIDVSGSPAIIDNILYIGSSDGTINAIDATTGVIQDTFTTPTGSRTSAIGGADGWSFTNRPGRIGNTKPIPPF